MVGQQPPGGLDPALQRALGSDQHDVGLLPAEPAEQFVTAAHTVDRVDRADRGHHPGQPVPSGAPLVAYQDARHVAPFLNIPAPAGPTRTWATRIRVLRCRRWPGPTCAAPPSGARYPMRTHGAGGQVEQDADDGMAISRSVAG